LTGDCCPHDGVMLGCCGWLMITNIALQQIIIDTTNISLTFTTSLNCIST
jgi:hypothetical protein